MLIPYRGFLVDPENGSVIGKKGYPLRGSLNLDGYRFCHTYAPQKKPIYWHRMIWAAVNGPIPAGMEINHINGVKDDNRISNLELVTRELNMQHAFRIGLQDKRGVKHPGHKLTEAQVYEIRRQRAAGRTLRAIGADFGVGVQTVHDIATRKSWKHLGEVA